MNVASRLKRNIPGLVIFAILLFLPFILPNPYIMSTMVYVAINGILALSMGVLLNYSGLFTMVQPVFLGIGAYTAALLALHGVSPVLAIIASGIVVAIVAFIIGAPVLRLRGFYLALELRDPPCRQYLLHSGKGHYWRAKRAFRYSPPVSGRLRSQRGRDLLLFDNGPVYGLSSRMREHH